MTQPALTSLRVGLHTACIRQDLDSADQFLIPFIAARAQ